MTHAALIVAVVLFTHSQQPELKPVEEGFEDVSPLASPNRLEPIDLRRPSGFEQVYEITTPSGEKAFVRIDNGLVAIFDRSDYLAGTNRAHIPPNTRFKIGTHGLTANSEPTIETTAASGRIDRRVSNRAPNRPSTYRAPQQQRIPASDSPDESDANVASVEGPPSIVTNEVYRRLRLTQLLLDAIEKP
ncbi:MAG: hypothetical protein Phyf2KO_01800 [Phycisphaerales bacterium]